MFQKKSASSNDADSVSKGILFKRSAQLYALVLAGYLTMVWLLLMSYQLDSFWGSRILLLILAFNFAVPVISFSLITKDNLGKQLGAPSETDKFMRSKGGNTSLSEAKNKQEFWLFLFGFSILIGISRMVDDNSTVIALSNQGKAQSNQRLYQTYEVIGAFVTGVFLSFFRIYISPYGLFMLYSFFLVVSQVLMFFIDTMPLANMVSVIIVAFISGGSFTLAGIIAHEDYGSKHYNKILGVFMTGAAIGILIFDQLVFGLFFNMLNDSSNSSYKGYGKWNKYIFIICTLSSVMAFIMSIGGFTRTRARDGNKDKISDFVNF